jgi:hypothetical protein
MRVLANGTWSPIHRVSPDQHEGPIASDPQSGWIFLPLAGNVEAVARSHDLGRTWQIVNLTGTPSETFIFPVVAVDSAGTVYLVYSTDPAAPTPGTFLVTDLVARPQVYLSISRDHGATWSTPAVISPAGHTAIFPWIAAGAPGRVAVAWYEGTLGTPSNHVPDVWHVAVAVSTTADSANATWKESLADPQPIHVGSICTEGTGCLLTASDRSLLDFFEIRLLPDGSPVLAYSSDAQPHMVAVLVKATRMTSGTPLRS